MPTRTGSFPIGFRRGGSPWQQDIASLVEWSKAAGFEAVDLNRATTADVKVINDAGLRLGSVDLIDFGNIVAPDAGKRNVLLAANLAYIKEAAGFGAKVFFTIVGAEPSRSRSENYKAAVEAFAPLADAAAAVDAKIAIEGYPGSSPNFALLCTTPETCRAFIKDVGGAIAINYDASHLIRLGVDHIRFLQEFAPHVAHVHAKDTEIFADKIYELGLYQPSAFDPGHGYGDHVWRYTLPGHGVARWTSIFEILKSAGYAGAVSVELEDEHFNGTESGEKAGFVHSLNFLRGA